MLEFKKKKKGHIEWIWNNSKLIVKRGRFQARISRWIWISSGNIFLGVGMDLDFSSGKVLTLFRGGWWGPRGGLSLFVSARGEWFREHINWEILSAHHFRLSEHLFTNVVNPLLLTIRCGAHKVKCCGHLEFPH